MKRKLQRKEKLSFNRAGYQVNLKDLNGVPLPRLEKLAFRHLEHNATKIGVRRKPSGRRPVL
jgi:hypothetical protein